MISSTAFLSLIIIGSLVLLVVFTWTMRKLFKMRMGTAVVVNLILVPVLLGGLIMGVAEPFKVTIVENDHWMPYWVFGADQLDYTLANGDSLHITPPEAGLCLVNNSDDTLVIEKVYYGTGSADNLSYLLMVEPMSGASFAGLALDFTFADQPPLSISTSKSATKVKRYWLRHLSDDDFDNFVLFHGETFRGKPHGEGKLFDPGSGEILEGIWDKGTFLGLGEVGDATEPEVHQTENADAQ